MLYTLIGNGTAPNTKEVLASLESLRSAVPEGDDFWMAFLDTAGSGTALSDTVEGILGWVQGLGIYHESVLLVDNVASSSLSKADETHFARRPLDFIVKLTKGRLQPGEKSAILVLSDNLDQDALALYAIERAIAEDIPVYDLAGQMVQVLLEEESPEMEPIPEARQVTDEEAMEAGKTKEDLAHLKMVASGRGGWDHTPDLRPMVENPEVLAGEAVAPTMTPNPALEDGKDDMQEFGESKVGQPADDLPVSQPLVLSRLMLEDLTRNELKHLVRTHGVTPTDLRSKESMILALLQEEDEAAAFDGAVKKAETLFPDVGSSGTAEVSSVTITPWDGVVQEIPGYPMVTLHYYVQVNPDGAATMRLIPNDAIEPLLTILSNA